MPSLPPTTDDATTVLLVDDDPDALRLLSLELHQVGFRVAQAPSGEAALAALAFSLPDAVLLDVLMPGMDGFETCRRIRNAHPHLPILFMTGLGETEHILRGFEVGGTDYVTKPIAPSVVVARLHVHTRMSGLMRATREAINATNVAMLAVDNQGHIAWRNAAATTLLKSLAPALYAPEQRQLPQALACLSDTREATHRLVLPQGTLLARRVTENPQNVTVYTLQPEQDSRSTIHSMPCLTDREGEVLLWVARGKTNRDIADILGMSPRTVGKHMEHIFEKLGVETRTAAAGAAARLPPLQSQK